MAAATQAQIAEAVYDALDGALSKTEVRDVLSAYKDVVLGEVESGEPVNILGLVKVNVKYVPAKPRRKGINPFDPEAGEQWFAAKPESLGVKATALAGVKSALPSTKSAAGKAIVAALTKPVRKKAAAKPAAKKAPVKKGRK